MSIIIELIFGILKLFIQKGGWKMVQSVSEWIEKVMSNKDYKNQTAFINDQGFKFSYEEVIEKSFEFANALRGAGIEKGDHIAVWLQNSIEWTALEIGCGIIGATLVCLNTRYHSHEVSYILKQSESKILFFSNNVDGRSADSVLEEIMPEIYDTLYTSNFKEFPFLQKTVCMSELFPKGAWSIKDFIANFRTNDDRTINSDKNDILNILYTSGSTSKPKGAMLSQQTIISHSFNISNHLNASKADTSLEVLPFCGIMGLNSMWAALLGGVTMIVPETFKIDQVCQLISKYKCTIFNAVDEMHSKIMEYKKDHSVDLSSLRIGTTGVFIYDETEIISGMEENSNFRILHTYGMSEVGSMLLLRDPAEPLETRVISGGKPVSGKIKIINPDTLIEVPDLERGEIIVSGPNVLTSYYKAPDKTVEAFLEDGYFRTGDLGIKYPDGTVEYHGRLREALRLSGFLVSPAEIEDFLNKLESIELSQVVGIKNSQKVMVVAFVILKKGSKLSVVDMHNYCQSLAYFKRPKHIFIVDKFPTTPGPNGEKVVKNKLVEMAQSMIVSQI